MPFQRDPRTGLIPADASRPPRQVLRSEAHAPFLEDFERKENRGKANPGCRVWQGLPCVRLPLISMVFGPRDACIIAVSCAVQVFASSRLVVNSLPGEERDRSIVATLFLPPSTFRWLAFLLSPHVSGVSVSRGREGGTPTPHLQRHENPALAVAGK